jgi:hypothetical protein
MKKLLIIPLAFILANCSLLNETYYVKSINSHYANENNNSQTYLTVWQEGKSGHVKEVFCAFPPELKLTGNNENGWLGASKIEVGEKYEEFAMENSSYLCTALEFEKTELKPTKIDPREQLKKAAFDAVDKKNEKWDENIEIADVDESGKAAIGYWSNWDKWHWIGYQDENGKWNILVDMDGFNCKEVDLIPAKYNVFFSDLIFINKDTRNCY